MIRKLVLVLVALIALSGCEWKASLTTGGGGQVAWSCGTHHYLMLIDPKATVAPWVPGVIRDAIAEWSRLTGDSWVEDGTTDEVPQAPSWTPDDPTVIGVADVASSPLFSAGTRWGFGWARQGNDGNIDSGFAMVLAGPGWNPVDTRATLRHELGHLAGLAHVSDPGEVMDPDGLRSRYGPGDRLGLRIAGGCLTRWKLGVRLVP